MLQRGSARRLQAAHSLEPLVGSSEGPTAGASELSLLVGSSDDGSESPTERHTLAWPTPVSIEKHKKKEELQWKGEGAPPFAAATVIASAADLCCNRWEHLGGAFGCMLKAGHAGPHVCGLPSRRPRVSGLSGSKRTVAAAEVVAVTAPSAPMGVAPPISKRACVGRQSTPSPLLLNEQPPSLPIGEVADASAHRVRPTSASADAPSSSASASAYDDSSDALTVDVSPYASSAPPPVTLVPRVTLAKAAAPVPRLPGGANAITTLGMGSGAAAVAAVAAAAAAAAAAAEAVAAAEAMNGTNVAAAAAVAAAGGAGAVAATGGTAAAGSAPAGPPRKLVLFSWAQCDKCSKWRRLPPGHEPSEDAFWECSMNPKRSLNTCEAAEEEMAENELAGEKLEAVKQQRKQQRRLQQLQRQRQQQQQQQQRRRRRGPGADELQQQQQQQQRRGGGTSADAELAAATGRRARKPARRGTSSEGADEAPVPVAHQHSARRGTGFDDAGSEGADGGLVGRSSSRRVRARTASTVVDEDEALGALGDETLCDETLGDEMADDEMADEIGLPLLGCGMGDLAVGFDDDEEAEDDASLDHTSPDNTSDEGAAPPSGALPVRARVVDRAAATRSAGEAPPAPAAPLPPAAVTGAPLPPGAVPSALGAAAAASPCGTGGGAAEGEMSLERMMLAHEAMRQLEHLQQALECDDDELVVRALPHDPPPFASCSAPLTRPTYLPGQADPALEGLGLDGGGESPFLALCDNSFLA